MSNEDKLKLTRQSMDRIHKPTQVIEPKKKKRIEKALEKASREDGRL